MTEQKEYLIDLLRLAQSGDQVAEDNLITYIKNNLMKRRISRYLHKNRQVEDEDLMQEFMIGAALSIRKADLDIGDPIEYILSQGVYRVKSYFRKNILKNTTQVCRECGHESRLHKVGNTYVCRKCGSTDIETREMYDHDEIILENTQSTNDEIERLIDDTGADKIIEQFRDTLDKDTKAYYLFVLLYDRDINSGNPDVNNYIAEIAKQWGTSQTLVVQTKEKLKNKLLKFCAQNGYVIRDNRFIQIK